MTTKKQQPEVILDEDDSDADYLPQLDNEPAPEKTRKTKTEKPAATFKTTSDLAAMLKLDGKVVRAMLRKIAKTDESGVYRVRAGGGYQWSTSELTKVAKRLAKDLDAIAERKSDGAA